MLFKADLSFFEKNASKRKYVVVIKAKGVQWVKNADGTFKTVLQSLGEDWAMAGSVPLERIPDSVYSAQFMIYISEGKRLAGCMAISTKPIDRVPCAMTSTTT